MLIAHVKGEDLLKLIFGHKPKLLKVHEEFGGCCLQVFDDETEVVHELAFKLFEFVHELNLVVLERDPESMLESKGLQEIGEVLLQHFFEGIAEELQVEVDVDEAGLVLPFEFNPVEADFELLVDGGADDLSKSSETKQFFC